MEEGLATADGRRRPTDRLTLPEWGKLALAGSAIVALGSVRPWVTLRRAEAADITAGGLSGDGVASLFFAVLVAATVLVVAYRSDAGPGRYSAWTTLFSGITVGLLVYGVYSTGRSDMRTFAASSGAGDVVALDVHASLFVVALGGVLLVAAGVVGLLRGGAGSPED
ncbi:hypothetical protein [Halovivax sp.]|uniref:hypothetical protein n=1 Tax=Halovivax sp. TaxID=1935978 RepID=UPI0025BF0F3F|nr:hypothetical protein [Halovivax sp.]